MVAPLASKHMPLLGLLLAAAARADPGGGGCNCEAMCTSNSLWHIVKQQRERIAELEAEVRRLRGGSGASPSARRTATSEALCGGDWEIASDSDVEAYRGCRTARNITISGVESLAGLQNLESAGAVTILGNPKLKNLSGLEQLVRVEKGLEMQGNSRLTSLLALQGLQSVGWLLVKENPQLRSLAGLENVTSVGSLEIRENDRLESLAAFQRVERVPGDLIVHRNDKLQNLSVFDSLTRVGGELRLSSLEELESFSFESLTSVGGDLFVVFCKKIRTMTFQRLESAKALHVDSHNDDFLEQLMLERLESVDKLLVQSGNLSLLSAPSLHTAGEIVLKLEHKTTHLTALFENLKSVGDLTFSAMDVGLTGFTSLENVTDVLKISTGGNGLSFTGAFQKLEFVKKMDCNNNAFQQFPAMRSSLTRVDALTLSNSANLESLVGLAHLAYVDNFTIQGCDQLVNLSGLESLGRVGVMTVQACGGLEDLVGLERLAVVDTLTIQDCGRLAHLTGLKGLSDVRELTLSSLGNLVSVAGLQGVLRAQLVSIRDCGALRSLEGFGKLAVGSLLVRKNPSMEYLGGPFSTAGASAQSFVIDSTSWPPCITAHEHMALLSKVLNASIPIPATATWPPWPPACHRPNFGNVSCTRGQPCSFSLAGDSGGYTSVFISGRLGGCGLCDTEPRPRGNVMENGVVDLGYALKHKEAGLRSICRCAAGLGALGPVAQLVLRGPRRSSKVTECASGLRCTVKLEGEGLQATDRMVLMNHCSGNPLLGFRASWSGENTYRLDDELWYTATPGLYKVCWRAPCSSSMDGPVCPAPEDEYLEVGEVELAGSFSRHYTIVLGELLEIPNIGHLVSDGDQMRLLRACGEADEDGMRAPEANSSQQLFDFGRLTEDRTRAGSRSLCWCQRRDGAECNAEQHFVTEAGSVRILCPTGQELTAGSGLCQDCPPGRQRLEPGLEPCSECLPGQFSLGGGAECEACRDGKVAEQTGSAACTACQSWERADVDAAVCSADVVLVGILVSFSFFVGAASALLVRAIKRQLLVLDVSLDHSCTIVTTFGSHGLSNFGRASFPVRFCGTGHPGLDKPPQRFRATVVDAERLELLTWAGQAVSQRLDTAMGTLLVDSPHDLYHQGGLVPVTFTLLVLLTMAVALGVAVLEADMAAEGGLGAAAAVLVFTAASAAVRWRPRTTPLARRLSEFKQKLDKQPVTYREKGAERALAVGKLHDVLEAFRDFIRDRSAYFLDSNILRPLTKEKRVSYAELAGAERVEWFVSHFWGTPFEHFCMALRKHAEMACGDRAWTTLPYWVCFCSNNQYQIQEELGAGWEDSSFFLTLKSGHCQGTCMVLDDQALPLTRIWCIFELLQTVKLARVGAFQGLLLCTSGGVLNTGNGSVEVAMALAEKVADMDLASAQSSSESDAMMIRAQVIAEMGSFAALKDFVRSEVRSMLMRAQTSANQHFAAVFTHLDGGVTEPEFAAV